MEEYIYKYTRKNAIDDGVLIDISDIASEYGFKINTCLSATLFHKYFYNEGEVEKYLLSMFLVDLNQKIMSEGGETDRVFISCLGEEVVCHIGPGDEGEAVITICYPIEL